MSLSLKVPKTIKMFMNGQFPRTESGRSFPIYTSGKQIYANACLGSRKDVRSAVEMAKKAQPGWSGKTAYNRSQILYRMAEMSESKRLEFNQVLIEVFSKSDKEATDIVDQVIATMIYYAGFADKYAQVISSINPVSGPYHNFTAPEAVGVVGSICANEFDFVKTMDHICSVLCSGNSMVLLMHKEAAAILAPVAEVFATSDVPAGVINLISGDNQELYKHLAGHMEVNSLYYQGEDKQWVTQIKELAIENMKRVIPATNSGKNLKNILDFTEFKTVWHPIGL